MMIVIPNVMKLLKKDYPKKRDLNNFQKLKNNYLNPLVKKT